MCEGETTDGGRPRTSQGREERADERLHEAVDVVAEGAAEDETDGDGNRLKARRKKRGGGRQGKE